MACGDFLKAKNEIFLVKTNDLFYQNKQSKAFKRRIGISKEI